MDDGAKVRAAAERLRAWDALPPGCPLQDRYAVYRGEGVDGLTGLNMAHQRDLKLVARAYLALLPGVQAAREALRVYARPDFYLFLLDLVGQQTDPTRRAKEALAMLDGGPEHATAFKVA